MSEDKKYVIPKMNRELVLDKVNLWIKKNPRLANSNLKTRISGAQIIFSKAEKQKNEITLLRITVKNSEFSDCDIEVKSGTGGWQVFDVGFSFPECLAKAETIITA